MTPEVHKEMMNVSDDIIKHLSKTGVSPKLAFLALCMSLARMAIVSNIAPDTIMTFVRAFRRACLAAEERRKAEDDINWN